MAKSVGSKRSNPPPSAVGESRGAPSPPLQGRAFVPLNQIDASALRTRDLNERHVAALAESIGAIGIIHPPAVDRMNRLLAGAHRLAALRLLQRESNARFLELFPEGVPVWRMDLNANSDLDLALAVEISENEQRRDYSPAEIHKLADRLKAAGFHYSVEGGRPKADVRPLMPALETIVGKSVRQLRRVLNPVTSLKPQVAPKTRPSDLVFDLKKHFESAQEIIARLGPSPEIPELFTLKAQLERTNRSITLALNALNKPFLPPST